jgi:hypothetical protein
MYIKILIYIYKYFQKGVKIILVKEKESAIEKQSSKKVER